MSHGVTIVIADPRRVETLRHGLELPGRVLCLSSSNLPSAFESIRAHQPGLVVLDALFSPTPEGHAFVQRVKQLAIAQSEIRLLELVNGAWTATPMESERAPAPAVEPQKTDFNTRRAPRFLVVDPLPAVVEGHATNLVDISVLGAQVVSEPVLRPNQRIKITLPDTDDMLRLTAHIAWSLFEKPKHATKPYYRVGMEFDNATGQVLERYCRRHCVGNPLLVGLLRGIRFLPLR
jgi:hypothetical protein